MNTPDMITYAYGQNVGDVLIFLLWKWSVRPPSHVTIGLGPHYWLIRCWKWMFRENECFLKISESLLYDTNPDNIIDHQPPPSSSMSIVNHDTPDRDPLRLAPFHPFVLEHPATWPLHHGQSYPCHSLSHLSLRLSHMDFLRDLLLRQILQYRNLGAGRVARGSAGPLLSDNSRRILIYSENRPVSLFLHIFAMGSSFHLCFLLSFFSLSFLFQRGSSRGSSDFPDASIAISLVLRLFLGIFGVFFGAFLGGFGLWNSFSTTSAWEDDFPFTKLIAILDGAWCHMYAMRVRLVWAV